MKSVVLTALAFVFFSLGAATTAVAQEEAVAQQGTISQSFMQEVSLANVAQFEEAYLRHVECSEGPGSQADIIDTNQIQGHTRQQDKIRYKLFSCFHNHFSLLHSTVAEHFEPIGQRSHNG